MTDIRPLRQLHQTMLSYASESNPARALPSQSRSLFRPWLCVQLVVAVGCSDSSPTDPDTPPASHPSGGATSTGGATSLTGAGGENVQLPSTGGTQGTLPDPSLMNEILIEEDELGFCFVDGVIETTAAQWILDHIQPGDYWFKISDSVRCPEAVYLRTRLGPVGDFFCDDHTHFSDIGGAQIASLIANAIASSDLGLSAYLE